MIVLAWLLPLIGGQRPYRLLQSTITGLLVGGVFSGFSQGAHERDVRG